MEGLVGLIAIMRNLIKNIRKKQRIYPRPLVTI